MTNTYAKILYKEDVEGLYCAACHERHPSDRESFMYPACHTAARTNVSFVEEGGEKLAVVCCGRCGAAVATLAVSAIPEQTNFINVQVCLKSAHIYLLVGQTNVVCGQVPVIGRDGTVPPAPFDILGDVLSGATPLERVSGVAKIGDRVCALASADAVTVRLIGFGVYTSDKEMEGDQAKYLTEAAKLFGLPDPTDPVITLDSGEVVYGTECWFFPESEYESVVGKRSVVQITLDELRGDAV